MDMNKKEPIIRCLFFLTGIIIFVMLLTPLVNSVTLASDINLNQDNIYKKLLEKSFTSLEFTMNKKSYVKKNSMPNILFKYLTNIELTNPKTYIASQIPLLNSVDITSINDEENYEEYKLEEEKVDENTDELIEENNESKNSNTGKSNVEIKTIVPKNNVEAKKAKLDPRKPLVLIYHTHTQEAYNPRKIEGANHSTNLNLGVVKVGEYMKDELENKYGIAVIHDTTIHDIPVREKGYEKSRVTLKKYLAKYKNFKIIIDLHRDAGDKNIFTVKANNELYAKIMFVLGSKNKNYAKNLNTARQINDIVDGMYPGISKGFRNMNAYLNQDLSPNVVLIEVGSNENTMEEAINTAEILAKTIAKIINK
ncbi:stage II sporulation protein P [Fervidicella metallireducens AeB]|uniref:Stage II sporulation protein P n=1 Tax=Fervidicella metallireducens AeB TaxID=1403537 RepID=A0A017RTX5_9CLOT|nr:stage II sporulation protein P [Fervidicella metallireducens]EYE88107.1 stage II sporulation protein P [Fervidicella metallireducens AeB]